VRGSGKLPITSLQFNLERIAEGVSFEGLETTVTPNPKAFSNFDMFWNVAESARGLRIDCDYNCDILDRSTVARWLDAYAALLAEIARDTSRPVAQVTVSSVAEHELLTHTLNQTQREYPRTSRVSDLFEARAAETPQAIAVIDANHEITYAELDRRANRLARLIERSVPAEGRVAIAVDRSHQLLVALLAVMKAGRTYVPLDIELPPARIEQLLALADVSAVLCDADASAALAPREVFQIRMDAAKKQNHSDRSSQRHVLRRT
jgi:non-ribosomal peptide synthetase component F